MIERLARSFSAMVRIRMERMWRKRFPVILDSRSHRLRRNSAW